MNAVWILLLVLAAVAAFWKQIKAAFAAKPETELDHLEADTAKLVHIADHFAKAGMTEQSKACTALIEHLVTMHNSPKPAGGRHA